MSQIKDYLEQGRAGKAYDPNQGLYMDPKSGKAFVPTFTNVSNSNIQGDVESRMDGPSKLDARPYLVSGGPGGMPGRGETQQTQQRPDARDPWAMAQEHMKSAGFKNEIYKEMFGRDPQSGFRTHEERNKYYKALQSTRNILVDKFKWQIIQKEKRDAALLKDAQKQMGQKEAMELLITYTEKYNEEYGDKEGWEAKYGNKTADQVAKDKFVEDLKFANETFNPPAGGGGMPGRGEESSATGDQPAAAEQAGPTTDPDRNITFSSLSQQEKNKMFRFSRERAINEGITGEDNIKARTREIMQANFTRRELQTGEYTGSPTEVDNNVKARDDLTGNTFLGRSVGGLGYHYQQ